MTTRHSYASGPKGQRGKAAISDQDRVRQELAALLNDPRYRYDNDYKSYVRRQFQRVYNDRSGAPRGQTVGGPRVFATELEPYDPPARDQSAAMLARPPHPAARSRIDVDRPGIMGVAAKAPAGQDPFLLFLDDYWRGLTGEGQGSGWFGQNTVPQELRRLGELQDAIPKDDPFGPEFEAYSRAYLESNLVPGFGVSSSVGRVISALPMDKASRLARAAAMGFRTEMPLYHGTASDIRAFDPALFGRATQAPTARLGVWTALDPDLAGFFAEKAATTGSGQNIVQMFHRAQKPGVLHLPDDVLGHEVAATISLGLDEGYDAFLLRNFTRPDGTKTDILMVKDPAQLRSVHAAFDPAKRDSPDLLAGLDPPGFAALFIKEGGSDSEE